MVTVDVHDAFCLHPLPEGGAVAALRGLGLSVPRGELLVVHGPNGSGKTTLMRVLAGEQRLAAGRATVAGLDLATAGARDLARWRSGRLGQVDQDARRLLRPEFDVLDNVALQSRIAGKPRAQARSLAAAALDELGLGDLARCRVSELSGGQRQRVAICAALAHRPDLVLADEPTGELDLASADQVYGLLEKAVREAGATLVMVTHDRRAAQIADRVVRIRDGRISESWVPSGSEALVMDDRGWIRLPQAVRDQVPGGALWAPEVGEGRVGLRRTGLSDARGEVLPDHGRGLAAGRAGRAGRGEGRPGHAEGLAGGRGESSPDHGRGLVGDRGEGPPDHGAGLVGGRGEGLPDRGVGRGRGRGEVVVELSGVRLSYAGSSRQYVLGAPPGPGLDLTVRGGDLAAVSGRSGTGKSSLLRVVLGLQKPDEGVVRLGGQDLTGLDRDQRAKLRGQLSAVVMQQVHLALTADAAGVIDLARAARGLPADRERVLELLGRLGLQGLARRRVASLSGGERQRVTLARALALDPGLLVLDEPTSQLDEASAQLVTAVLEQTARSGTAVLVATHDPVLSAAASHLVLH
ncbi:ATP-binding cassette domain-containing protein [Kineosporia sp. NBRC 101731]|uniref:ATP-binding cassette domain-containing protein n=1 Tax=Kineosporia sp. NBRC 101731 TaxID=3032199 RepID=UPI0024A0CCF3|nr:ATP-binding cassette domain-containing protein [Kineosporia sp. NBRC 101731]GLY27106.1 hypothetical protein Kisp02_04710 [Kineosporia sp. NBRC 101731]